MQRRTILNEISCIGHCPFNGGVGKVKLCPAESFSGIRFIRDDLIDKNSDTSINEKNKIFLNKNENFDCTKLSTIVANQYHSIFMIEHILSSLWAFKITDIDIHLNCNEVPMLDGSSSYWVKILESAGLKDLDEKFEYKYINKEIKYEEDDKYIIVRPCDRLKINYTIDFKEATIGKNTFIYDENINSYKKDISYARTFCTAEQIKTHQTIKKDFNNNDILIYDHDKVYYANKITKLRYPNEATRHKILDLIGDLMSTGNFFCAEFICYKSGHKMNRKIVNLINN